MLKLNVLEILIEDHLPAIFLVEEDFYNIFLRHKPTGINFSIHMGKKEKPQPGVYQRIAREKNQEDLIYEFEKEIFKRLKVNSESSSEADSARNTMLIELDSDFRSILKHL